MISWSIAKIFSQVATEAKKQALKGGIRTPHLFCREKEKDPLSTSNCKKTLPPQETILTFTYKIFRMNTLHEPILHL